MNKNIFKKSPFTWIVFGPLFNLLGKKIQLYTEVKVPVCWPTSGMWRCVTSLKEASPPWDSRNPLTCYRAVVKSCSVGHWESQQSIPSGLLVSRIVLSLLQKVAGQLRWNEYAGALDSTALPGTELPENPRHVFSSAETFASTWFLAERKVHLVTHLSLSCSVNFGRVLLLLLKTMIKAP